MLWAEELHLRLEVHVTTECDQLLVSAGLRTVFAHCVLKLDWCP
jgi:hypothetical protein